MRSWDGPGWMRTCMYRDIIVHQNVIPQVTLPPFVHSTERKDTVRRWKILFDHISHDFSMRICLVHCNMYPVLDIPERKNSRRALTTCLLINICLGVGRPCGSSARYAAQRTSLLNLSRLYIGCCLCLDGRINLQCWEEQTRGSIAGF